MRRPAFRRIDGGPRAGAFSQSVDHASLELQGPRYWLWGMADSETEAVTFGSCFLRCRAPVNLTACSVHFVGIAQWKCQGPQHARGRREA